MFAMNIHKLLWISNLESFVFYNQFVQMNITFLVQWQRNQTVLKMKCEVSNYKQYMTTITKFVSKIVIVSESTSQIQDLSCTEMKCFRIERGNEIVPPYNSEEYLVQSLAIKQILRAIVTMRTSGHKSLPV